MNTFDFLPKLPEEQCQALKDQAAMIRRLYLKKPIGQSNVAIGEVYLANGLCFGAGATSKRQSPIPKPLPRSQGGQFEPIWVSYNERIMDTDAELKVLDAIATTLATRYDRSVSGSLYLYTELKPCPSCRGVIEQFQERFPNICLFIAWDITYPPITLSNSL
ncbi:MAG: deaminase domain-containing protein [Prochlorothrix sp.]|nr:deaminase domain-containing protein [Prochlorothrix sp.]